MIEQDAVEIAPADLAADPVAVSRWEPFAAIELRLGGHLRSGLAYERFDFPGGRIAFRV